MSPARNDVVNFTINNNDSKTVVYPPHIGLQSTRGAVLRVLDVVAVETL